MSSFKILIKLDAFNQVVDLDKSYPNYPTELLYGGHVVEFHINNISRIFTITTELIDATKVPVTGIELSIDGIVIHMKFDSSTNIFSIIETNEVPAIYNKIVNSFADKELEVTYTQRKIQTVTDHLSHADKHNPNNNTHGNNNQVINTDISLNDATAIYFNFLEPLLPSLMRIDGNSENFKKILSTYAKQESNMNHDMNLLNDIYDINNLSGRLIDVYGSLYNMYRKANEDDTSFKNRIRIRSMRRIIPNSVISIQQAIDSLVAPVFNNKGELIYGFTIVENPVISSTGEKEHASSALLGHATREETEVILELLKNILPVGVQVTNQVVILESWQKVKDTFKDWQELKDSVYTW